MSWTSLKITGDWIATGKAIVMLQFGLRKSPELPNVRMLQDLATNAKHREIFEFLCLVPAMGRPFFMPPGVPAERVAAVRAAFAATMKDPAFLDEARRARLDVAPLTGEEIAKIVAMKFNAPEDVRAVGKKVME